MDANLRYLVVLDFPGIKKFVFGTDRLVTVRGGSALLDQLNRYFIPDMVAKHYARESQLVFAGGGAAQFIIHDSFDGVHKFFCDIAGEVKLRSGGGLSLLFGMAEVDNEKDSYRRALEKAFLNLNEAKNNNIFSFGAAHNSYIKECDSCAGMASDIFEYAGENLFLCEACRKKMEFGRKRGLWQEFKEFLGEQKEQVISAEDDEPLERPRDFVEIGKLCQKSGYTALVYGDGNAMGRIVKEIDTPERFTIFSQVVDESVRLACYEALNACCSRVKGKIPADILLLGGDDVMVYLAADTALPFAIHVAKRFEEIARQKFNSGSEAKYFKTLLDEGLTISLGIAYGKSHTPVSIMVNQSEELLKSAKQKGSSVAGSKSKYTPACLDFHFTSHFRQVRVSDSRELHLYKESTKKEALYLYGGPYTLEEAEKLYSCASQLKTSKISKVRLNRLGKSPFLGRGRVSCCIEVMTISTRCKKEERTAIQKILHELGCTPLQPWVKKDGSDKSWFSPLVDLVEMSDFVKNGKTGE